MSNMMRKTDVVTFGAYVWVNEKLQDVAQLLQGGSFHFGEFLFFLFSLLQKMRKGQILGL